MKQPLQFIAAAVLVLGWPASVFASEPLAPRPLAAHPGNIFVEGEPVAIPIPENSLSEWVLYNYEGQTIPIQKIAGQEIQAGPLPAGYYELKKARGEDHPTNRISLGVLAPLKKPTPPNSPIALDVAMSWFYPADKMKAVASLCSLAGINWVRDRLMWKEMEAQRGQFITRTNRYDMAAEAQTAAGLKVLQVIHLSPLWANTNRTRFPLDLRDAHRFYEQMARRWRGQVLAFEPWNEADIEMFGGHTGGEIASLQKAAYLGLKAGNPKIIACQNVFALHNPAILADFHANEAWPYFDTFNLHHYAPLEDYPRLYADFRAVSAGKPLWVTECSIPVKWSGDALWQEPSGTDLRVQAERVAKIFAASLYEGSQATYYFLLPHYAEGQTQFGILRKDLTPRPAYLALAAAGRLLAEAKPLGRLLVTNSDVRGYWFACRPDGLKREVLVAWSARKTADIELTVNPVAAFDHLGRPVDHHSSWGHLNETPRFLVFKPGSVKMTAVEPPPKPAEILTGKPSPVVLQALWPQDRIDLQHSAYRVKAQQEEQIPVFACNFGPKKVRIDFSLRVPSDWKVKFPESLEIQPGERAQVPMAILSTLPKTDSPYSTVRLEGAIRGKSPAILSLVLAPR